MKFLVILLVVFVAKCQAECPHDSGLWCTSAEVAESCGVTKQCRELVWSSKPLGNDLVNVTLYYESLCPGCREFTTTQLFKAYQSIASIMNITVIPYGNANETFNATTQQWDFACQHGPDECWGNLLHSCLIFYYPDTKDHLPFIDCMELDNQDNIKFAAIKCAKKFPQISYNTLSDCFNGKQGNDLQHQNALKTGSLNPPHTYVPWIVLNDVHTDAIEQQALNDLVGLVCQTYQGPNKPSACTTSN